MAAFDEPRPTWTIIKLDAPNISGWGITQPMAFCLFERNTAAQARAIELVTEIEEKRVWYFMEVSIQYTLEHQEAQNVEPLAEERLDVQWKMVSDIQFGLRTVF